MTRKRTTIIPGKEVCPDYTLAADGRTIDYTGPRTGAHYCGRAYGRRVAGIPTDRYPSGYRWAVWALGDEEPAPCATCGGIVAPEACRVKLVALDGWHVRGGPHAQSAYKAELAADKVDDVHHVACVDWRAWYTPWQRSGLTGASKRRTSIERQGILGLLDSPCRVTLAERWRTVLSEPWSWAAKHVKDDLGMTLDQLELFYERSDATAEAVAA